VYLTNGPDVVRVARGGWIAPNLTTSTESDEGSSRPRMADSHGETLIPGAEAGPSSKNGSTLPLTGITYLYRHDRAGFTSI
jgi:hypothetical protein